MTYQEYVDGYGEYRNLGINVIGGPNWQSHVDDICANMSDSWCQSAKEHLDMEPVPLKSQEWSSQITLSWQYQEYDPTYADEEKEMPLITPGLSSISEVPIHMVVGEYDNVCSFNAAAKL